jgi:hypothetical protein
MSRIKPTVERPGCGILDASKSCIYSRLYGARKI